MWAYYNEVTKTVTPIEASNDQVALLALSRPVVWVERYEGEAERRKNEDMLRRRIEGLREAVRRWRVKAGVDEPPEGMMLHSVEVWERQNRWMIERHYLLPVEKSPDLLYEAWAFVKGKGLNVKRIYYRPGVGWLVVIQEEMDV